MKKQKSEKMRKFWTDLWRLLLPLQKNLKKLLVWIIIVDAMRLVGPFIFKTIIDKLANFNSEEMILLVGLIFSMLIAEQTVSALHYFREIMIMKVIVGIEYYLPIQAQRKLTYLSLNYHEKENTGSKIVKIEKGVDKVMDLVEDMSWDVVPTVVQLVITTSVLFLIDWRFGLSFLIFVPLFVGITFHVNKSLESKRKKRYKNYEISSGKMAQSIININTVKSFAQEEKEVGDFENIRKKIKESLTWEWSRLLLFGLTRNFVIDLGRTTILLLGVYFAWQGSVTIGTLVFIVTLSEKAYMSLFRLSHLYDKIEDSRAAVKRFMALSDAKSDIVNPKNGLKPKRIDGKIQFKNVDFSYNGDDIKALKNVSLKITSGSTVAFVGPSGGGKTTLARMIYRHYDPNAGEILLDGDNLKEYDLYAMRKFMAIVPQEVEIFDLSVGENIAYAKSNASPEEIQAVAKVANADEFIQKLSEGYETMVGERGVKLSGGQRQRIGIARALLANPSILIFDEATSSLDSQSEVLIQQAMDRISRGRTTIMIAHRLSTIRKADKIVVIEDGRIVEEGNHLELSKNRGGIYAKLLKLQKMGDVGE